MMWVKFVIAKALNAFNNFVFDGELFEIYEYLFINIGVFNGMLRLGFVFNY